MDEHHEQHIPEGYEPGSDADIHISSILFVGVIGAVLTIVIVLLLKAFYYRTLNEERLEKMGQGIDLQLANLRTTQLEDLARYRWVDARGGKVGIPIEDAKSLVVSELAGRPYNGIEISDWDHAASDQNPVPGNLVMLGSGHRTTTDWNELLEQQGLSETATNVEHQSGTEDVPADAIAETEAESIAAPHGEDTNGDEAAGGEH